MCPESAMQQLSPIRWRRRSWRSIVAGRRENFIISGVPVSNRVQELERRCNEAYNEDLKGLKEMLQHLIELTMQQTYNVKGDNAEENASEELQATISELQEVRQTLLTFERKYATLQKKNEKLQTEVEKLELKLKAYESGNSKKSSGRGTVWRLNQSLDENLLCCDGRSSTRAQVLELKEEVALLNKELEKRNATIECDGMDSNDPTEAEKALDLFIGGISEERALHKAQLKDFLVAVKVAEKRRDEAQAEIARMIDASREVTSQDEVIWSDLMSKFQHSTKRNALLSWAQAHLTAYPSISVANFTSDWFDGRAFCALIHNYYPDKIDRSVLLQREQCQQYAIQLASKLNIHVDNLFSIDPKPDYKHVMEVVFELYKKLELDKRNSDIWPKVT